MVYTSPCKVARIVELTNLGQSTHEVATKLNLHRTTVTWILHHQEESSDPYFWKQKSGHPHLLKECDTRYAALLLARTEAANVTEVTKKAFSQVSCVTMSRALHVYGLVCRVCHTKPFISEANWIKRWDWAGVTNHQRTEALHRLVIVDLDTYYHLTFL